MVRRQVLYIGSILLGAWLGYQLYPEALLNSAQLERLRGDNPVQVYQRALASAPESAHLRWQTSAALERAGDPVRAADTLLPLEDRPGLDPLAVSLLLTSLHEAGRENEALRVLQKQATPPPLSSVVAASIARTFVNQSSNLPLSAPLARTLLAQSLELAPSSPEFQVIGERLFETGFWSDEVGQRVRKTLDWRGQNWPEENRPFEASWLDRQSIAGILGILPTDVEFGPELARNGSFEEQTPGGYLPQGWIPSFMASGNPWNRGTFVVGTDRVNPFSGNRSLRIDGLALEHLKGLEPARAGLWHPPVELEAGKPFLISLAFRTEGTADQVAALWLASDPQVLGGYGSERWFPATEGKWKKMSLLGWNTSSKTVQIEPLLRAWGEGSVWFDEFSIREIRLAAPQPPRAPSLLITDAATVK